MAPNLIVSILGTVFLIGSVVWPTKKWGGYVIRIALSALSVGLFAANSVYALCS